SRGDTLHREGSASGSRCRAPRRRTAPPHPSPRPARATPPSTAGRRPGTTPRVPRSSCRRCLLLPMRAHTTVDLLPEVAVHAQDLEPRRVLLIPQPAIEDVSAAFDHFPVSGSVIVDVIDRQELLGRLSAAGANASSVRLVRRDLEFSSMPRADLAVPLLDCRVGSPAALLLFPVFPRSLRVNGPPERREACPKLLRSSTVVLAHVCCALRTLLFQRQHQPP